MLPVPSPDRRRSAHGTDAVRPDVEVRIDVYQAQGVLFQSGALHQSCDTGIREIMASAYHERDPAH